LPLDAAKLLLLTQAPAAPPQPPPAPRVGLKMWLVERGDWIDFNIESWI